MKSFVEYLGSTVLGAKRGRIIQRRMMRMLNHEPDEELI
jgi:hypothetical protein